MRRSAWIGADLDEDGRCLVVRDSKFAKSRGSPCTRPAWKPWPTTGELRDQRFPDSRTPPFGLSQRQEALPPEHRVRLPSPRSPVAGLTPRSERCHPRLHDFRHSLAVDTLLGWYRSGLDVQSRLPVLSTFFGHTKPANTLLVSLGGARTVGPGGRATPARMELRHDALAPTLESFFTERLIGQRRASPNTVAAYRDAWRLLLGYASDRIGKQPSQLDMADLDAPFLAGFLDHLEAERGNGVRTRNARLAAVRSFFRYAALCHPEHAGLIARSWPSPPSGPTATSCPTLTARGRTPFSLPRPGDLDRPADHALIDVAVELACGSRS